MAIYMQFAKIAGDVTTKGFEKWIELHSFSWGVHRNFGSAKGSALNRASSEALLGEVHVTKPTDAATIKLFGESIKGKYDNKVVISFTETGAAAGASNPYLKIELEKCAISAFQISGSKDQRPMEALTLNFVKITKTHTPIKEDKSGTPESDSWDQSLNS